MCTKRLPTADEARDRLGLVRDIAARTERVRQAAAISRAYSTVAVSSLATAELQRACTLAERDESGQQRRRQLRTLSEGGSLPEFSNPEKPREARAPIKNAVDCASGCTKGILIMLACL